MGLYCMLQRLAADDATRVIQEPESALEVFDPDADDSGHLHLDKAWHAIHFLLTGTGWGGEAPLDFIVNGGTSIGDDEYPTRVFDAAATRAIAAALVPLTSDVIAARFDPAAMLAEDIYPSIWDRDPEDDDTRGYVLSGYEELRSYVMRTAEQGQGLAISIG